MAATAVTALGVAGSLYGANRQRRDANRAAQQQADAEAQRLALAREGLDWNRQRYGQWENLFLPVLDELRNEAFSDRGPDYSMIAGDVGAAFDASQGMNRRQMERYGVRPTDGAVAASELGYGLGRASATVDARNKARIAHRDQRFNRLGQVYGMGNTMMSSALGGVNAGYGALGGVYGDQAAGAGNRAQLHGQAAAAGYGAAFNGLGQLAGSFGTGGQTGGAGSGPGPWAGGYQYPAGTGGYTPPRWG